MSDNILRAAARIRHPAFPANDRKISQTSLQSLRDYRRMRYATRLVPVQPKAAA